MKNYYNLTLILSFFLVGNLQSQVEFSFEILSPADIEAVHQPGSFASSQFEWGGIVTENIIGPLAYAPEDIDGDHFLCDLPATDLTDKFVLIERGFCHFSLKAFNAQERGAKAVIIRNFEEQALSMNVGTHGDQVNIPVIMIPLSMGEGLVTALENNEDVTVAFIVNQILNIDNINQEEVLKIFPNPMKEKSVFELFETDFQIGKIEIYDLLGRVVREEIFSQHKFDLLRKNLKAGSYFYKIILDGKYSATGKFQVVD